MRSYELEQALRRIYEVAYVPAISYALLLTQHPKAAVATVEKVFMRYAREKTPPSDPLWLFDKISIVAPSKVLQEGMLPGNTFSHFRRGISWMQGGIFIRGGGRMHHTTQTLITDPVRAALDRHTFVGIDSQYYTPLLLRWLIYGFSDMRLLAILELWLQRPENRIHGAEYRDTGTLVADLIGLDAEDASELLERHRDLWQEITTEEKKPPTLEQVLSAWPTILELPSIQTQITETVARENRLWRHPVVRFMKSSLLLALIITFLTGIIRPDLGLLPWQWRYVAQIPWHSNTSVLDLSVESLTLYHPWKGLFYCRDAQKRDIMITIQYHEPNAQFIPAREDDHFQSLVDVEDEKAALMRIANTEQLYIQYYDFNHHYLYRIEGDLSEQELIRLCRHLGALLREDER